MPKLLIAGAAGFLGQALTRRFCGEYQVTGIINHSPLDFDHANLTVERLDLLDFPRTKQLFVRYRPELVINSAAWVDVDGCESDRGRAYAANYKVAENLSICSQDQGARLIQISTDYIFNGWDQAACEDDPPAPLNYYGETKLLAENQIKATHGDFLIARTCSLFSAPQPGKTNLLNYFYNSLKSGRKIQMPDDLFSNPIWIDNLADLLFEAVEKKLKGVIHLGGPDYLSRYEFALLFAEVFKFDARLIEPVKAQTQLRPAPRPRFAGLNIERTRILLETPLMPAREALLQIRGSLD